MILYVIITLVMISVITSFVGITIFNAAVEKEKAILFDSQGEASQNISEEDLDELPHLLKNYLIKIKIVGKPKYCNVAFTQRGKIKSDSKKGWLPFTAVQYMSSVNSGFVWKLKAFPMLVRDKYLEEKGEVKISLLGLKNMERLTGSEVDQSSLGRYFGELIWFPIGFLDRDIEWSEVDEETLKGTIKKGGLVLIGYFHFDKDGMISSYSTQRYRDTRLENFIGEVGVYKLYDGILIPDRMIAIWDTEEGREEYFVADIIDYNMVHDTD